MPDVRRAFEKNNKKRCRKLIEEYLPQIDEQVREELKLEVDKLLQSSLDCIPWLDSDFET